MEICKRCKLAKKCGASSESDVCLNYEPRQQTNYDRIISKTPEELTDWLSQTQDREGDICPPKHGWQYCIMADGCRVCWLDWLKRPADMEEEGWTT